MENDAALLARLSTIARAIEVSNRSSFRFAAARAFSALVEKQVAELGQERASNLLRGRADIVLEGQNQLLLQSMESRARQQLMLQQTVEGP